MSKDKALEGTSFSELAPAEHYGINLNLRGPEKSGKTYLALMTAPEPVAYLNGDRDNSRLIRWCLRAGRKIVSADPLYYSLPGPRQVTKRVNESVLKGIYQANSDCVLPFWTRFCRELRAALESKSIRSIVVDTGSWVFQSLRLAKYGTVSPPKWLAQEYKSEMEAIYHWPDQYGKVLIWIHRVAPEYEDFWKCVEHETDIQECGCPKTAAKADSRTTGRWRTDGLDKTDYIMDATIELAFDLNESGARAGRIVTGIGGVGKKLEGEALSIPGFCGLITRTKPESWLG